MQLKLGLFVLGTALCQLFGTALGRKKKHPVVTNTNDEDKAPNACFQLVHKKNTLFAFEGFDDAQIKSSTNDFLHPKKLSKDIYTPDCTDKVEAETTFCKLLMSSNADCTLDGKKEFSSLVEGQTKKSRTNYCLKVWLQDDRYRYTIEELEDEKCAFEEKESASLTSNAGLRNRRRRLLQDDTGSSGC